MDTSDIITKIKDCSHSKIKIAVTDIDGVLRGKYMHKEKFLHALDNGFGFCDVIFGWDCNDRCYENSELTGWHTGYPDARALIDLDTYREIPWENNTPFVLADFSKDPHYEQNICPRSLLKRIVNQCQQMGFTPVFSQEFEWFNFTGTPTEIHEAQYKDLQPISPGMFGYSILRTSLNQQYCSELFELLMQFDIPLEGMHTETGPGVMEATVIYDQALTAADKAVLFKTAIKEIAYRHNMVATFMAKWNIHLPGCGGHLHQSLWDIKRQKNLFFDPASPDKQNRLMASYIAGLLKCLPDILPMLAPNPNSYSRLSGGDWAPCTLTWGVDNRTCAIRALPEKSNSARVELRVPGADTNAYLAIAASLAAGLYGIQNNLTLDIENTRGNGYLEKKNGVLPSSLQDAVAKMADSKIAHQLFGKGFVHHFVKTRQWECMQVDDKDISAHLKRYFEII